MYQGVNNLINDLEWTGNSKKMYDAILREVPFIFAASVKKSIEHWIVKNDIHVVTEDLVFKAVDDIAPKNLAENRIKPALEKLRSK